VILPRVKRVRSGLSRSGITSEADSNTSRTDCSFKPNLFTDSEALFVIFRLFFLSLYSGKEILSSELFKLFTGAAKKIVAGTDLFLIDDLY
jgi:hypothetical protein